MKHISFRWQNHPFHHDVLSERTRRLLDRVIGNGKEGLQENFWQSKLLWKVVLLLILFSTYWVLAKCMMVLLGYFDTERTSAQQRNDDEESRLVFERLLSKRALTFVSISEEDSCCPICLVEYNERVATGTPEYDKTNAVVRIASCRHDFHTECLLGWCLKSMTCPCCRIDLRKDLVDPTATDTAASFSFSSLLASTTQEIQETRQQHREQWKETVSSVVASLSVVAISIGITGWFTNSPAQFSSSPLIKGSVALLLAKFWIVLQQGSSETLLEDWNSNSPPTSTASTRRRQFSHRNTMTTIVPKVIFLSIYLLASSVLVGMCCATLTS